MKKLIIIQARLGSTRLPEKVMAKIGDYTVIEILGKQMEGLKSKGFEIVFAIPLSDFVLQKYLQDFGHQVVLGAEENVFSRFLTAIEQYQPDVVIRITGDCPFVDPDIIWKMYNDFSENKLDYLTNDEQYGGFPRGFDAEIIKREVFDVMVQKPLTHRDKEHVTSYIVEHWDQFKIGVFQSRMPKEEVKGIRLCIDTKQDLDYVRDVWKRLNNPSFPIFHDRIIQLIQQQSLWR